MKRQCWHEKEKYEHDAQLDEKHQDQSAEFSFVDLKEMRGPGDTGVPKEVGRDKIEQGKYEANDKCAEEKIPKENDLLAFHSAIIHFGGARSITFPWDSSVLDRKRY